MDSAHGPDRNEADTGTPPNVYLPVGDPRSTPAYEVFADPATAHGWQNAYDDTIQLDGLEIVPLADALPGEIRGGAGGGTAPGATGGAPYAEGASYGEGVSYEEGLAYGGGAPHGEGAPYEDPAPHAPGNPGADDDGAYAGTGGPEAVGDGVGRRARPAGGRRSTLGRRRARRRSAWVAGGIGAAVLVGVAAAGLAGLGGGDKEGPNGPEPVRSAPADDRSGDADAATPSASADTGAEKAPGDSSPDDSPSPSSTSTATTTEPSDPASPSATSTPSSAAPTATETTSSRGNGNGNQGRGQGATKDPR
ncbi:hypothetical protein [Streptomyces sp. AC495_CC817]|uniref:hypothetical protein n=1 Tax=Streptomyces sp. AC495_CC817 TaxID=2823900 RepID=UPI001C277173|nr:hypothetical protein [Streptomyces sp. AC495_CC817]